MALREKPTMEEGEEQRGAARGERLGNSGRSLAWERNQCWYMLSALTVWFYWFPFVYTGFRVMNTRWIGWGFAYGIPAFLLWFLDLGGVRHDMKYAMAIALVVSTVHAWLTRGEYLDRLAELDDEVEMLQERSRLRREAADGQRPAEPVYRATQPAYQPPEPVHDQAAPNPYRRPAIPQVQESVTAEPPVTESRRSMLFDYNLLTERDFALLPDMGLERGRQAVALREQLGSFRSFDHFAEKMGLSPHACERLRPLFIEPPPPETAENSEYRQEIDGTYVLDINLVSVDALTTLPGIDHELARKIVQLRDADGPFKSSEDFRFRMGLTIDQFVPLQPIISTYRTSDNQADRGRKPKGRIVDV
ncbi:MAG TPA: helix-hairpin-helix domain-containing protein [Burkholderiales bacterium]|jgi:competence protein ComEA